LANVQTRATPAAATAAAVAAVAATVAASIDPSGPELYPSSLAFSLPSTRWSKFGFTHAGTHFI
jgi:hypothetical protein